MVHIALKASEIEETRRQSEAMKEVPTDTRRDAGQIEKPLLREDAGPEGGTELQKRVAMPKMDCVAADQTVKPLADKLKDAFIPDPDGRKGPTQRAQHP